MARCTDEYISPLLCTDRTDFFYDIAHILYLGPESNKGPQKVMLRMAHGSCVHVAESLSEAPRTPQSRLVSFSFHAMFHAGICPSLLCLEDADHGFEHVDVAGALWRVIADSCGILK